MPTREMPSLSTFQGGVFVAASVTLNHSQDLFISRSFDGGTTWEVPDVHIDSDSGGASQVRPALAISPSGVFVASWVDLRGGDTNIYFSRSINNGQTWSSPDARLNTDIGIAWQDSPAIAVDDSGGVYSAWADGRAGSGDIFVARSLDGGLSWPDSEVKVTDAGHASAYYPSIAATTAGTVVVTWQGQSSWPAGQDVFVVRSTDRGGTWSSPLKVNSDSAGANHYRPSVAAGPGGDVLLAWSDERLGYQQIYCAWSTDDGQTWTDPNVRVSATSNVQSDAAASVGSNFLGVGWVDNRGGALDVYFARSADGSVWTETRLAVGLGEQATPVLSTDGAGVYAVWQGDRSGAMPQRWEVRFSRSLDAGITWSADIPLGRLPSSPADQSSPAIQVGADGTIYAAWMDHRNGGDVFDNHDGDIYFSISTDVGQSWRRPSTRVSDATVRSAESMPVLRLGSGGELHLIWETPERRLVAARSTDGGISWSPAVPVVPDPAMTDQIYPDVAATAQGSLLVAFQGHRYGNWGTYVAASTDDGASWSPAIELPSLSGYGAAVGADRFGNVYVAWESTFSFGQSRIEISTSSDGGGTWSSPVAVGEWEAGSQASPRLAMDVNGAVYAVWVDTREGSADIYYSRSAQGTIWSPAQRINRDSGTAWQSSPSIATGPANSVFIAWVDERAGNADIYLSESTDGGQVWSSSDERVNDEGPSSLQFDPVVVADARRGVYVSWRDNRTGDWDIRFAKIDPVDESSDLKLQLAVLATATLGITTGTIVFVVLRRSGRSRAPSSAPRAEGPPRSPPG